MIELFKNRITKDKIINFILGELVGRFVGFAVALWTSKMFSKVVYEKRGINNLFGLAGRKKVVVNTTPEWLQWLLGAIVGFIVLELVNYFFEHKMHIKLWNKITGKEEKQLEEM